MKKVLLFIIALLFLPKVANAYDVEVNGIFYNLHGDEAEVTHYVAIVGISSAVYPRPQKGDVVVPENIVVDNKNYKVTSIGYGAYEKCQITSIQIPNSVKSIGGRAFESCEWLTDVNIPSSVGSIGENAFAGCYRLTSDITLPDAITKIEDGTFFGCSKVPAITLSSRTKTIGSGAFNGCSSLKSIKIPESVTSIDQSAFAGCGIETIKLSPQLTSIANYLFEGCTNLTQIDIPEGVTSIGKGAFVRCYNLSSIIFPSSLTFIDELIFAYCNQIDGNHLKDVYCLATDVPEVKADYYGDYFWTSFDWAYQPKDVTLHVPESAIEKYKKANEYEKFTIVPLKAGDIENESDDVTLTAKSYSRVYGDPNPTFEYTVTEGSITSGEPMITCEATATSPVGTYDIVIEKGSVSNSTVNLVNGTLTITKAPLTISAGDYTKVEGEDNPTFTPTFSGFKNNETKSVLTKQPTITTTATKDSPAGTYPVTVSGAEAQNYDFTYQNGTLTVTAKPQESNTFTSKTVEGVEMTFTILDEQKKICMVGVDNTDKTWLNAVTAIDNNTTGKLTIPEKANGYVVEKVGDYAFYSCKISEIVLPEGLASIGTFAFANCPITSVTLPSTLTFIGSNAFTKLETIYSYVINPFELSEKAFNYTNYQVAGGDGTTYYYYTANLYVPKGTKEKYASKPSWNHFMDNGDRIIEMENSEETYKDGDVFGVDVNGIWMVFRVLSAENKTVQIGSSTAENSNTTVDTAVNWETTNGVITIPSEVKGFKVIKIASGAFLKCANITEVIIPETVKSIGNRAFMSSGVSKVTIPEGVENIGDRAFLGSPITSVTLPSTLKFIGQFAFGWDGVAGHDRNDLEEIYCCVKEPFELSEKAFSYNRYIVTSTGEELFRYTGKLYVPSGTKDKYLATPTWNWFTSSNIIEMGQAEDNIQFADSNVKAICVQNWDKDYDGELSKDEAAAVKDIGTVFKETQIHMFNELQYFTGLTAIGNNAFRKCQMLTSIILPESIQKIGENAFTDCRELSALEIPATVTEIGQSVFAGCNHLIVTVAQGNKTFVAEDMMLYQKDKYGEQIETLLWCSPMKSGNVTINSAASTLADNCFYECGEIIGVEIPDNVKTLGDGVFVKCSKLENVFIGKGVESIGEGCFNATPKLRQITVYASNPYYAFDGGVLIKRQGNVLVAYPNAKGVQYKVREGIEAIGKWAFYYTNIASVTLPETLSSIEDYAFYDCKNLTEIIINTKMVPEVAAKSFGDVTFEQATLTVPAGMKSQYQTAEVWKNFKNIVEMQDTGINGVGVDDKAFKVYDMNGHKIRSEATSLESLPKGVYIINGRKVVK